MHANITNVNLANGDLWEVEHFETQVGQLTSDNKRLAIPDFQIPIYRRSRIMAARFFNPVAKPYWKLGCYLKQSVAAPAALDPSGFVELAAWRVPLHLPNLTRNQRLFFPDPVATTWQLLASVPTWHQEAHITVWSYTGEISTPLIDQIETIRAQQVEINNKLNQLLAS